MKNTAGGFTNENALFRNQFAGITHRVILPWKDIFEP